MLHALPELLDALEAKLIAGEDPLPMLTSVRWSDLVGWPEAADQAQALKRRVRKLDMLIQGLQAPLRATLEEVQGAPVYRPSVKRPDRV